MFIVTGWHFGCKSKWQSKAPLLQFHLERVRKREVIIVTSKNEYEGVDQRWKCLHLLAGTIEIPKRCLRNHECGCCGFDQWLEQAGPMPTRAPHISLAVRETLAA